MSKAGDLMSLLNESGNKITDINDPIYTKKQKFPKYNVPISPISAHSSADGAKILKSRLSGWTKEDHLAAAEYHEEQSKKKDADWGKTREKAHKDVFGTDPGFSDYKVSGIGRDEYSDKDKAKLRKLAAEASSHKSVAAVHKYLANNFGRYKNEAFDENEDKTLYFSTKGGHRFRISLNPDTLGHVVKYDQHTFDLPHNEWRIIGFSKNPNSKSPDIRVSTDLTRDKIRGMYVWDIDHNTNRRWSDKVDNM